MSIGSCSYVVIKNFSGGYVWKFSMPSFAFGG
nr:MAG TPA: hypothetical protein [Caudoviricetes sp.]